MIIVEDSALIRNSLRKFFSEINGLTITGEAENSRDAIELIKNEKPDIVTLDVELKESSGFDVLKYINENSFTDKPVVIMFTNHASLYKEKAQVEKPDYCFDKTNELDKLLATIEKLLSVKKN